MVKRRSVPRIITLLVAVLIVGGAILATLIFFHHSSDTATNQPAQPTPTKPVMTALECIDSMPDAAKIGQKIMVAGYHELLSGETPTLVRQQIGGIIVMNAMPTDEISSFKNSFVISPFIAVDQEGGTVQRYTAEGVLPGAIDMARGFSPDDAYERYLKDDKYLKDMGITTNFSPVVDVMSGSYDPLPGRMYSSDPAIVASYAQAAVRAAKDAGITPVIKHFPGLGSASGNTDYGSATTDPLSVLQTRDDIPYKELSLLSPDVMISNAIVPGLTDGAVAVWSPRTVKLLRGMGYEQSVVYSDSLTARAVPGSLGDAVVKAWQAGVDVALVVQTPDQTGQLDSYLDLVVASANNALQSGTYDRKELSVSLLRILNRKGIDACKLQLSN